MGFQKCYLETYNQKTFGALGRVADLCVGLSLRWKEVLSLLLVVLRDLG